MKIRSGASSLLFWALPAFAQYLPPTDTLPRPIQPSDAVFCRMLDTPPVASVAFNAMVFNPGAELIAELGSEFRTEREVLEFLAGRAIVTAKRSVIVKVGGYEILVRRGAVLYLVAGDGVVIAVNVFDSSRGSVKVGNGTNSVDLDVGSAFFRDSTRSVIDIVSLARLLVNDALVRSLYRAETHDALMKDMLKIAAAQCAIR